MISPESGKKLAVESYSAAVWVVSKRGDVLDSVVMVRGIEPRLALKWGPRTEMLLSIWTGQIVLPGTRVGVRWYLISASSITTRRVSWLIDHQFIIYECTNWTYQPTSVLDFIHSSIVLLATRRHVPVCHNYQISSPTPPWELVLAHRQRNRSL